MIKKAGLGILGIATSLCLALSGIGGGAIAFADGEKTIRSVSYNSHEVIIAGEPVLLQAEVTFTDGTTEMRPIRYTDFPVTKMHDVFHDFNVRGYVDGSSETIDQTVLVLPSDVEYLINLGSNMTETDYEYSGEGVLGKELDPTGESSAADPYNAAIQRKFPDIKNKVGAKQYGHGTPSDVGDWGYTGGDLTTFKVNGSIENTGRNLFKHLVFPKRGSKDIEVKFSLPAQESEYDIYLGFYSYWFARLIDIQLNGTEIAGSYSVSPSENVYVSAGRTLGGEQTIRLNAHDRSDAYAQALAAFVCVTKADSREYAEIPAPTAPETVDLADTEIKVSDLTPNTVLQVYDYDKGTLLLERSVGADETECVISLAEIKTDDVNRFGICGSNAKYMGETAVVQRTDIQSFEVSYDSGYVGKELPVNLAAYAESKIVAIEVFDRDNQRILSRETVPAVNWEDTIYLQQNGDYRIEIESGRGGKSIKEISVGNIDNVAPSIGLIFDMNSAKASTNKSLALGVATESISTISETGYIYRGENAAADFSGGTVSFEKSGDYTLYFVNLLGKTSAVRFNVAMKASDSVTAAIAEDTSKRFKQISFTGRNGYEIAAINVYGNIGNETEKMIVNGTENDFNFAVYREGVYFAEIVAKDGVREYVVIDMLNEQSPGLSGGAIIAIAAGGAVVLAGAAAVTFLLVKRARNKRTSENSERSENK